MLFVASSSTMIELRRKSAARRCNQLSLALREFDPPDDTWVSNVTSVLDSTSVADAALEEPGVGVEIHDLVRQGNSLYEMLGAKYAETRKLYL